MMGRQQEQPEQPFYTFQLDRDVPRDHLLRQIDANLDLSEIQSAVRPYYSSIGRS